MSRPFLLIPWRHNFLNVLLDLALRDTDGDLSRAVFIFPHARPARYLNLLLRDKAGPRRPLIMPRCFTANGLIEELNRLILPYPRRNAGLLDRVGLLSAALREESRKTDMPFDTDAEHFFPWGIRLAALFEECLAQMQTPVNFLYAEDVALPYARTLLARLRPLFVRYRELLDASGYTTEGLNARTAAEFIEERGKLPDGFLAASLFSPSGAPAEKVIYLAGFHMPTGAENIIFRRMRDDRDARVVIHADPALAHPGDAEAHWSCRSFTDWAAEWGSRPELAPGCSGADAKEARIRFYAAYDLHSQLRILRRELAGYGDGRVPPSPPVGDAGGDRHADTAVFLPRGDLLIPALHHLPHTDINISMGWPLARSPLARLLDTAARLQEGRKGDAYYWRDLLDLLRHPYVKMLRPEGAAARSEADAGFRRELHRLDRALRARGRKYADLYAVIEEIYQATPPDELPPAPVLALLEESCRVFLDAFADAVSPATLAAALDGVCRLLLRCGGQPPEHFPIDSECLYRLRRSLIPELAESEMSAEALSRDALFALMRGLLDNERVPFEAEPLVGLQVMGMLESRLLSFRRVVIADAVEDALPGSPEGDPLLPDVLRPELGLPSQYNREQLVAHTFFRLVAGAEEVVLLWREGDDSGPPGQKKKKSRFVEELIWHEEKKRLKRLTGKENDGTLTILAPSVPPLNTAYRSITMDDTLRGLMEKLLERRVSASLLDAWLRCPAAFFYERLARIAPAVEPEEGDDPLAVGNMLHAALRDFYGGRLHQALPPGADLPPGDLALLKKSVFGSDICAGLFRRLPADSRIMIEEAVDKRLAAYLDKQPATTVLAAECGLSAPFPRSSGPHPERTDDMPATPFSLTGTLDRLDLRDRAQGTGGKKTSSPENASLCDTRPEIIILDYKTGSPVKIAPALWRDENLLQRLKAWNAGERQRTDGEEEGRSLFSAIADRLPSIQMPFYLLLYSLAQDRGTLPPGPDRHGAVPALNAAWVDIGGDGAENFLFPDDVSFEERKEAIRDFIPTLLTFLLRRMLTAPSADPRPGRHCDWCSSKKLCMIAVDRTDAPSTP